VRLLAVRPGARFELQGPAVKTMTAGAALSDSSRDSNAVGQDC
jgi:hypothetical protein